jgi:hypothetical protein
MTLTQNPENAARRRFEHPVSAFSDEVYTVSSPPSSQPSTYDGDTLRRRGIVANNDDTDVDYDANAYFIAHGRDRS